MTADSGEMEPQEAIDKESVSESDVDTERDAENDDGVFSGVVGHAGAKSFVSAALRKGDVHVLMHGPPGSGKSIMMLAIEDNIPGVVYRDCKQLTGSRLREVLRDDPPILLLDEIDALDNDDYAVLNVPMEQGRVVRDSAREQYEEEIGTQIIAACNWPENLPDDVADRFRHIEFEAYDHEEYLDVCAVMLTSEIEWITDESDAREIGKAVSEATGEDKPRAARDIARLASSVEEAKQLAKVRHDADADVHAAALQPEEVARAQGEVKKDDVRERFVEELLRASRERSGEHDGESAQESGRDDGSDDGGGGGDATADSADESAVDESGDAAEEVIEEAVEDAVS